MATLIVFAACIAALLLLIWIDPANLSPKHQDRQS